MPAAAGVRSRATAFDVLRAAEIHRYKVIVVENVAEPAPGIVSRPNVSLVIPGGRTSRSRTTAEPLHALATHDSAALV